jgi:deoxyribodipyrimidine photo-lyase
VAGVGADPREDRYFSVPKQAKQYDPRGEFQRLWCRGAQGKPVVSLLQDRQPRAAVHA